MNECLEFRKKSFSHLLLDYSCIFRKPVYNNKVRKNMRLFKESLEEETKIDISRSSKTSGRENHNVYNRSQSVMSSVRKKTDVFVF